MLSAILLTLATNVITWFVKKFNISGTFVAMGIAIIGWAIYYISTNYFAIEWKQLVEFVIWIYGASQLVYSLIIKRIPVKKDTTIQ